MVDARAPLPQGEGEGEGVCVVEGNASGCALGCECGLMLTLGSRVQEGRH